MRRRSPSIAALVLVALVLLGLGAAPWLLHGGGTRGEETQRVTDGESATGASPILEGRKRVAPPTGADGLAGVSSPAPPAPGPDGPEANAPAPSEVRAPRRFAGAAALVHVVLRVPPSWRSNEGRLYALPAGARADDDGQDLPRSRVPVGETEAQLPLPQEGLWDVGFTCAYGHVLATDVRVEGVTEVTLDAREAAPIRFRLPRTGPVPSGSLVDVRTAGGVAFPGRGQVASIQIKLAVEAGVPLATPPLQPGVAYLVTCGTPAGVRAPDGQPGVEWGADRATAYAGEEVGLSVRALGLVRLTLDVGAPLPASWVTGWHVDIWTSVSAQGEGEPVPVHFVSTNLRRDGTLREDVLLLPLAAGRYTLEIGVGRAFRGQRRAVDVVAGQVLEVSSRLVPDPEVNPWSPLAPQEPGTQVSLRIDGPAQRGWFIAAQVERESGLQWDRHGSSNGGEIEVWSDALVVRALLVVPPDRASEAFVPPRRGDMSVPLRRAGILVVVPELIPDEELGALRVRRADGLPLPVLTSRTREPGSSQPESYEVEFEEAPLVELGTRLGPLPAGRQEFDVLLGGVTLARITVEVRGGVNTPLPIPLPAGPER